MFLVHPMGEPVEPLSRTLSCVEGHPGSNYRNLAKYSGRRLCFLFLQGIFKQLEYPFVLIGPTAWLNESMVFDWINR